jgi:arabinose-5-phosphate isomerase
MSAQADKIAQEEMARDMAHDMEGDLRSARRVLEIEAAALKALASALDDRFVKALDLLAGVSGRVVVTGLGKSGHVARKIAATLASTGTPAFYVHPGEASHGDLGMIAPGDALLALSNSGKTAELNDVVAHTRRRAIPLVAMTAKHNSTLAEAADVVLLLPDTAEACPMGLAPTSSTTMMLALGDAIAVALLERNEFSEEAFQALHPGGTLGRRLLRVAELMHEGTELPLCDGATTMSEAILTMTEKHFGCIGVVDRTGALMGIITDGDLRRHMSDGLLDLRAEKVMTPAPKTIRPRALAAEALGVMNSNSITSLFVVEGRQPVGIIHLHDCLRAGIS